MPPRVRSRRRLSWLSVNIVLNIIAASVIIWYQDTLDAVIALAGFLPIISDMSGCPGNQAVAVSIRERVARQYRFLVLEGDDMHRMFISLLTLALAGFVILAVMGPAVAETVTGTVQDVNIQKGTITIVTEDDQSKKLRAAPDQLEDIQDGDRVEIQVEEGAAKHIRKLKQL